MKPFFHEFADRGWVTIKQNSVAPFRDLLDYHTPFEALDIFQEKIDNILDSPDVNWYNNVLPILHFNVTFKTDEDQELFRNLKQEVTKRAALSLGLNHFLNIPSARGHKINRFDSPWVRKHVIPLIASKVIPITDYDEIMEFFGTHAFFCGRQDWDSKYMTTPYAEYKTVLLNPLDAAALT